MTFSISSIFAGSHLPQNAPIAMPRQALPVSSRIVDALLETTSNSTIASSSVRMPLSGRTIALGAGLLLGAAATVYYLWQRQPNTGAEHGKEPEPTPVQTENPLRSALAPPAAVPAAEMQDLKQTQTEQFKRALTLLLSAPLDSDTYTLHNYRNFISTQRRENYLVPIETMHEIVAQEFTRVHGSEVRGFIQRLQDHSTIDAEIAEIQAQASEQERTLRERDVTLAGETRFTGEIDGAWSQYFHAEKEVIRALAPLCRAMQGQPPCLSDHESYMLDVNLKDPRCKDGKIELSALKKGLKQLGAGNPNITNEDLLAQARGLEGLEPLVDALQQALIHAQSACDTYIRLDDERAAIAGKDIDPTTDPVAPESELAHVFDPVTDAQERREHIIEERVTKISFIQMMSSNLSLSIACGTVQADSRAL